MPSRVLLVRLSHLGDVVHALPVYHALRAAWPGAELAWVVQPEFADLVEGLPGVSRTIHFARRDGLRAWLRLERELELFGPEVAVDAQGNTKSAMVGLVSRAPRRIGLAWGDWRERFSAHVLTERAEPARGRHAMDRMHALARHLAPGAPLRHDPELTPVEIEAGRELCKEHLGAARLVLALPRPDDPRSLTRDQLVALARELTREGEELLVLSGPGEVELARSIASAAGGPRIRHWIGQRGLRELASFFQGAAGAGARLIACDSGPMHLAAACGVGVDLVAGPQDAGRTGPWPPPDREQQTGSSIHRAFRSPAPPDCAPCLRPRCHHRRGPVCMTELSMEWLSTRLLGVTDGDSRRIPE